MRDGETAADDDFVATVETLKAGKDTILWDSEFKGFGVRVQPTDLRSYLVNYRAGDRGRNAAKRRIVIGHHGPITADQAHRRGREILGRVALSEDQAGDRARSRAMPTLRQAFEDYLAAVNSSYFERKSIIDCKIMIITRTRRAYSEFFRIPSSNRMQIFSII